MASVLGDGTHAIWLADGNSGNWFTIIDVDATNRRLMILGEATRSSATNFRIRRQRVNCFDLRGPLMATRATFSVSSSWKLKRIVEQSVLVVAAHHAASSQQRPADHPLRHLGGGPHELQRLGISLDTVGLPLEPVIHVRPQAGVRFHGSLPLFRSYVPPSNLITASNDPSGYRWRVLFWRDMP